MSEFSRETLLNIIETDHVQCGEASALARMALAAMDSEPVAIIDQANLDYLRSGADADVWPPEREEMGDVLLYRHAQPAPVAYSDFESFWSSYIHPLAQDDELKGFAWDIWCAAMLQAGKSSAHVVDRPVAWHHSAKSKEGNHGTCCFSYASSHDFGPRYEKPQSQPHYLPERLDYDRALHFLSTEPRKVTPETVIAGSSPVIPDGSASMLRRWLAFGRGMQNAGSQLPRNLIAETEAMLADAPQSPGSESATVPGKWIPVSERMPDDDDFVYIWPRPDFGVELHVGQYCERSHKGGGWYAQVYEQNYGIEWHPITVTHWMPLPAAPQEVNRE